jgi:uracil-DNA glycosylase
MKRNCLRHFAATVEILEPTIMVLQGEGVQNWLGPVLGMTDDRTEHLADARVAGNRVLVCRFSHPSAHGACDGAIASTPLTSEKSWSRPSAWRSKPCR